MTLIQIITFINFYYKEVTRWLARLLMLVLCAEAAQVSARSALSLREIPSTRSMRLLASTAAHAKVHVPPALSLRLNQRDMFQKNGCPRTSVFVFINAGHSQNNNYAGHSQNIKQRRPLRFAPGPAHGGRFPQSGNLPPSSKIKQFRLHASMYGTVLFCPCLL